MNQIGYSNFRGVKDDVFFEAPINNITYLVGKNNSGKSTMVKALILILNFLKSNNLFWLDLTSKTFEKTNVLNFERTKNKYSKSDKITFKIDFNDEVKCHIECTGQNDFLEAQVVKFTLEVKNKFGFYRYLELDRAPQLRITNINPKKKENILNKKEQSEYEKFSLKIKDLRKLIKQQDKTSKEFINLNQEIKTLEKKRDLLKKDKTQEDLYDISFNIDDVGSLEETLLNAQKLANKLDYKSLTKFRGNFKKPKVAFKNLKSFANDKEAIVSIISYFKNGLNKSNIIYIPSNSFTPSTFLNINDPKNALTQAIYKYYRNWKKEKNHKYYNFIIKWMSNAKGFEIGEDFEIDLIESEAVTINIIIDQQKIPLSDLGMGSIRIVHLLFEIANAAFIQSFNNTSSTFIILEEPDLNLHPALQSKLCDLFLDAFETFKINFLVETHSEYLIRKSQLLVKDNQYEYEANENPFTVIYFDKDRDMAYPMEYRKDGKFANAFGSGFFDESTNLTLDLL